MNKIMEVIVQNPVDIGLIIIFLYPIVKGFLFKFSSKNLKNDIEDASSYSAFIIGSISGVYLSKGIFINRNREVYKKIYDCIPDSIISLIQNRPMFIYIVIMPITIFIIYKIVEITIGIVNRITIYPLLDRIETWMREKSSCTKRILGSLFQLPKAVCYVLLSTFVLNLLTMADISEDYNKSLQRSMVYEFLSNEIVSPITNSNFAKQLPNIINDSFKIVVKNDLEKQANNSSGTIVYYNGITLEEGLKSNEEIDNFARNLVKDKKTTRAKAKAIYEWIGKNVEYDYDKVEKILNNDFSIKSGAINTYYTRKGICFDYACLYSVMAKANGIKVRIITGEGFNGTSWVSHAWNQVYIEEEERWINVDTTFYKGGNYFDSTIFKLDHRNEKIAA
ncbi:transglutaminase domain-containing protein [Clostridium sp.]|jgi:transglutaminase-like putative cysteine protease|uniref:transglutaminase domain-containing protein n=1 Tax=Clostridium sp. TaxID=1506 RepID=UPI0039F54B73